MLYKNILITTGGTGGHIISGLTIAEKLIRLGHKVTWVGTKYRMEFNLVKKSNIEIDFINLNKYNYNFFLEKIFFCSDLLKSIYKSFDILKIRKPNIILGMGNYISIPICVAGWIKNIPVIIHEQNSVIGLTNKLLYFISKKFLLGFNIKKNDRCIYVGNPIRNNILNIPHASLRIKNRIGPIRILVLGGSQGSNFINYIVIKIIKDLNKNILIWHQTGENNRLDIYNLYCINKCTHLIYNISDFISNIEDAYLWSDFVICRAGALTVSEISIIGLPSLFIPFKHKDKHQFFNALELEKIGLSKIFDENCNYKTIVNYISNLDRYILFNMSIKSKILKIKNPNKKIIYEILNL